MPGQLFQKLRGHSADIRHLPCGCGHTFPFFQKEKGGKCIAVSFGVMLGLFPEIRPVFF